MFGGFFRQRQKIRIAPLPPLHKVRFFVPRKYQPTRAKNGVFLELNQVRMDQIKIKKDPVKFKTMCKNKKLSGLVLLVRELVRLLYGGRLHLRDPRREERVQVWALSG